MPYSKENKDAAKAYLADVRKNTYCKICGSQPVDFHRKEHEDDGNLRVSRMAARGVPINSLVKEISLCEALCRSCHMITDGRMFRLQLCKPFQKGTSLPMKPCIECGKLEKPLRKGLCNKCNHRKRSKEKKANDELNNCADAAERGW